MCEQGSDEIVERLEKIESVVIERNGELADMKEDVIVVKDGVDEIKDFLIGNIEDDKPGITERIRSIEKWVDGRKWFERLIITVVVGQFILYVLIQLNILPK